MVTRHSSAHANTSPTYPLTLFGQAVAVRGDLAMVGVPEFETVDANGNPVSGGKYEESPVRSYLSLKQFGIQLIWHCLELA